MTGFARSSGEADWGSWVWEGKSVNGKGLDARLNLPSGFEQVEKAVREAVSQRFSRGNLQISLRLETEIGDAGLSVNQTALKTLMDAYEQVDGTVATGTTLATLMSMKGVVEARFAHSRELAGDEAIVDTLSVSAVEMLDQLRSARRLEGTKLMDLLLGHLSEIAELTRQSTVFAGDQISHIQNQYRARVAELDSDHSVSDERLAAEIAILASKADVNEELDRLAAHVEAGRALVSSSEPIGRNLGFLAQELNREANTLCSKSASLDLTNVGLALKSVIDQFKEQAANVE
ncbi:MAG: YicC family protein [Alphaproteobacteria bacterium]|nr:YicC family protein [Alphaproteobacteria bacterium]